jgi:hypothetical protein
MAETRLLCLSTRDAKAVTREANTAASRSNRAYQDGPVVVIAYYDKRFAMDVAEWAFDHGHADDDAAAAAIASL